MVVVSTVEAVHFPVVSDAHSKQWTILAMVVKLAAVEPQVSTAHSSDINAEVAIFASAFEWSLLPTHLVITSTVVGLVKDITERTLEVFFVATETITSDKDLVESVLALRVIFGPLHGDAAVQNSGLEAAAHAFGALDA